METLPSSFSTGWRWFSRVSFRQISPETDSVRQSFSFSQEGIRELDGLQSYTEVQLGSLQALIHAHKLCSPVDREAVTSLDTRLREERKRADDQVRNSQAKWTIFAA